MGVKQHIFVLMVLYLSRYNEADNKYSRELNDEKAGNLFRMNKINMLWEKAQKRLSEEVLSDLFLELKPQDKLELEAKKRKAEGLDEDGEYEAMVRNKLIDIMVKFDMHEQLEVPHQENEVYTDPKTLKLETLKMDKKLSKLLMNAKMQGFSSEELNSLKAELQHHQQKLDEYNQLKENIEEYDGFAANSIEHLKDIDVDWKTSKLKREELKKKHNDLKDSYLYLESLAEKKAIGKLEFNEPKVVELWLMALKANFSDIELSSLKEELHHFEHKLKKHQFYKEQVVSSEGSFKGIGKSNDQLPDKHSELLDMEKGYGLKVKKIHHELKTRIDKALGLHTEL